MLWHYKSNIVDQEDRMSIDSIKGSMENAIEYFQANPDAALVTDAVATATVENLLRCTAEAPDGTSVSSDMPEGVGGTGSAPSPGWLLRAALANCDATIIAMRAAQVGVQITQLEVVVDSQSDDRGFLGMDKAIPAGPLSVRTRIRIAAEGVDPEVLQGIVKWSEEFSPVADALRRVVPMATEVEIG